ncbi:uncharacterized protein LOC129581820 [Paramacrobiotus metropolitanus]|uniref:uncharacterized protein LOC129581820 n=1 Tax=Paramacrobiotus metropolitanus TaxID=2943436 RepID=UPI0024459E55|nr:uncharacterized protein LOC129581820 [Paramacrobiotus metropolitanus]
MFCLWVLGFTSLLAVMVEGYETSATMPVKHYLVPGHFKRTPGLENEFVSDYYWSEVIIPHGTDFRVTCPRENFNAPPTGWDLEAGPNAGNMVGIMGGRYSSNFETYGTPGCPDTLTRDLRRQCWMHQACTISAQDPSTDPFCSKRPLRLRYRCLNEGKAVLVTTIIE